MCILLFYASCFFFALEKCFDRHFLTFMQRGNSRRSEASDRASPRVKEGGFVSPLSFDSREGDRREDVQADTLLLTRLDVCT